MRKSREEATSTNKPLTQQNMPVTKRRRRDSYISSAFTSILHALQSTFSGPSREKSQALPRDFLLQLPPNVLLRFALREELIELIDVAEAKGANLEEALFLAVHSGEVKHIQLLEQSGVDIRARDSNMNTALHIAGLVDNIEVIKTLLQLGANIDDGNLKGDTVLHDACMLGKLDIVKELVALGADIDAKNILGKTPIFHAVAYQHRSIFDFLLEKGADPDNVTKLQSNLADIAMMGDKDEDNDFADHVKRKIEVKSNVLSKFYNDFYALLEREMDYALKKGKKLLILVGEAHNVYKIRQAEMKMLEIAKKFGINTLLYEATNDQLDCINQPATCFIDSSIKMGVNVYGIDSPELRERRGGLWANIQPRNMWMVEETNQFDENLIIMIGKVHLKGCLTHPTVKFDDKFHIIPINLVGFIDEQRYQNVTAPYRIFSQYIERTSPFNDLYCDYSNNSKHVIQVLSDGSLTVFNANQHLLEITTDVLTDEVIEIEDFKKDPEFVLCASLDLFHSIDLLKISKELGANLERKLFQKISQQEIEHIKLLCDAGVNLAYKFKEMTPLNHAVTLGKEKVVRTLIEAGALVNLPAESNDESPLYFAIKIGNMVIIKILIEEYGAKIDEVTALALARERKHEEIFEYLSKKFSSQNSTVCKMGSENLMESPASYVPTLQHHIDTTIMPSRAITTQTTLTSPQAPSKSWCTLS